MSLDSTSSLKKHATVVVSYNAVESNGSSSSSVEEAPLLGRIGNNSWRTRTQRYLASEVDSENVTWPLLGYLFMAGYIDAISFTTIFVWCGFQTGNFAQVSLAVARTIEATFLNPRSGILNTLVSLPKTEQASICSLSAFFFGLATFGRLGDKVGTHKRGWLFAGTLIQALLSLTAAYTFWDLEDHSGPVSSLRHLAGVACLSASLGVQGIMARRLGTQFSTTIVLTAIFVELTADPTLFQVMRPVRSRDQKWLAVFALGFGVVVGRLILGQLGTALTIGVGVLIRITIASSWLFIPASRVQLP
ncbi:hypothetical protein D9611_006584 [Ephemerocybe angulata]|uniref:Uncharacterized protein n=1 Tax=Ephemerocybe angulata TaxID=980116 RepID=A0A8H5FH25_9AGAR|nr:hypothetical protein D9611_006584 [Tulosesus angulatus]